MIDEYTRRLISIGFPYSDAFRLCCDYYKAGTLPGFVKEQEEIYRRQCASYAAEVMG